MPAAPTSLAALRHLLAERFPTLPKSAGRVLPTGIAGLDAATGGLPLGAVTEIVCQTPSCGGQLFLGQLLTVTRAASLRVALIDGHDAFDPASFPSDTLAHLVWVRCRTFTEALRATDFLARDANLALVVLDLRRAPEADWRRTPATTWHRLQRAATDAGLALVVITPRPAVPSAQLRLILSTPHDLSALSTPRATLATTLAPTLQRHRLSAASA